MTVTITDCENLLIGSPWFADWWRTFPTTNFTLELEYSLNGGEVTTITLDETNLNALDPFELPFASEQGVYSFTIVRTNADLTIERDFLCFFNECDLNCEVAENLSTGCATTHRLLTFLRAINDCNECDCKYANIAYNLLLKQSKVTPLNNTTNDCGCN